MSQSLQFTCDACGAKGLADFSHQPETIPQWVCPKGWTWLRGRCESGGIDTAHLCCTCGQDWRKKLTPTQPNKGSV